MEKIIREGSLRVLASETSTDVVLSCSGHKLMAHKILLSIASPLLQELFLSSPPASDPVVLIFPDVKPEIMSHILDYIYTGSVTIFSTEMPEFVEVAALLNLRLESKIVAENGSRCVDMGLKRKLPNLLPISLLRSKGTRKKEPCNSVLPGPWSRRQEPLLVDPKTDCVTAIAVDKNQRVTQNSAKKENLNDSNNNSYRSLSSTTFPEETNFCKSEELKIPETTKQEATIEEVKGSDEEKAEKNPKPYKCKECGKGFSQLRNYKYHRSMHEGTKEFATNCPECGKVFNDRGYLSSHLKIHRDRKEYACPHCPKRFNQRVAYNMHLRIHTGMKPHECPTCGKSFSRKMLLKQHQRVHTGERPYSCPECGKSFADRSNMSLHARLHTGIKPYTCNVCSKSFTKKHHLKTHMNFHTGLKPYSCQKCGLAFSQSSNMRTHYKKCILKSQENTTNTQNSS